MREITNDKSNYSFEQWIFVSVWEHEQPQIGKTMNMRGKFSNKDSAKKPFQRRHYCDWSINILQQATK